MSQQLLRRRDEGATATLTLTAPARLNALSDEMIECLRATLDEIAADAGIRVVILAAEGKAFCAGHDLREMTAARQAADGGAAYFADLFARCSALMTAIRDMPQPVIAQVHGVAAAAGCQLVATCDLAIAAETARFGVNGVNIGLFCSTPMVALSRNLPRKKAFELLVTGDFLSAEDAQQLGLVNHVVPEAQLQSATAELAAKIAAKLGSAVRVGKRAFYQQAEMPLDQAYAFTGQVMATNMMDDDTAEGIAAFLDKRAPDWTQ